MTTQVLSFRDVHGMELQQQSQLIRSYKRGKYKKYIVSYHIFIGGEKFSIDYNLEFLSFPSWSFFSSAATFPLLLRQHRQLISIFHRWRLCVIYETHYLYYTTYRLKRENVIEREDTTTKTTSKLSLWFDGGEKEEDDETPIQMRWSACLLSFVKVHSRCRPGWLNF